MYFNKKNDSFTFKFVRYYDIKNLFDVISKYDDEWLENTSRQDISKLHEGVHVLTQSCRIYMNPLDWSIGDEYAAHFVCKDPELWKHVEPIILDLEKIYSGKVGRATIVKLPPNSLVFPHEDPYVYPNVIHRIHVPIITNDSVFFSVYDSTKNLLAGEAWEVNNAKLHGCYNFGNTDRVHLIVDIIPISLIGTNKVLDENTNQN